MRAMITLVALAVIAAPAATQTPSGSQAALEMIIAPLVRGQAPGCAVAAADNGKRIATAAFGLADLEHGVPITAASVFEAGSVSKQFTAAAILLLAADGKVALSDNVRKYLPELPDYGTPITVDHLLSHISGLRDWGQVASVQGWERSTRAYTNDDVLRIISRQKSLNYKPGDEYSYTNSGYNLLAVIVFRVSGQSLAAFTKSRLFGPLGMTHTEWRDDFRRIVQDHAVAYDPTADGWQEARPFEDAYGNGGLLTTVGDLLIWNEALSADRIGPGITARMQTRATLNDGRRTSYARGLTVGRYRGMDSISHSGSTGGYRAWLERFPANGLSVAVLCNGGSFTPTSIGRAFVDSRLPEPAALPAGKIVTSEDPHLGTFVSQTTGKPMRLTEVDGRLKPEDGSSLQDMGDGRFGADHTEIAFTDGDRFDYINSDGQRTAFVRAVPFTPDPAMLAGYAGRYASDEAEAVYDVTAEETGLRLTLVSRPKLNVLTKPAYPDAFTHGDTLLRFRRDAGGKITAMSFGIARVRDLTFARSSRSLRP